MRLGGTTLADARFPDVELIDLLGMPRRIYTYPSGLGWDTLNLVSTIGGFAFAFGVLLTFINLVVALRRGEAAGPDPWGADTLEWATASPPPDYNFEAIPIVESRHPLWDQRPLPVATSGDTPATEAFGTEGARRRTTPITTGFRAEPETTMTIRYQGGRAVQ